MRQTVDGDINPKNGLATNRASTGGLGCEIYDTADVFKNSKKKRTVVNGVTVI